MLLISAIFLTLGHTREHHSHFIGRNYQEIFNSLPSQNQLQDKAFQKCFLKSFLTSNWTEAEVEAIPAIGIISRNLEILDECADDVSKRIKRDLDVTQIEFLVDWLYYGNSTDFLGLAIPQIPEELPILINNLLGVLGKFNGFISYIRTRLANTDYDVIVIRIQTIVRRDIFIQKSAGLTPIHFSSSFSKLPKDMQMQQFVQSINFWDFFTLVLFLLLSVT